MESVITCQLNQSKDTLVVEEFSAIELVNLLQEVEGPAIERHGIELEIAIDPLIEIASDRHQIMQILINLFKNARQSVSEITTRKTPISPFLLKRRTIQILVSRLRIMEKAFYRKNSKKSFNTVSQPAVKVAALACIVRPPPRQNWAGNSKQQAMDLVRARLSRYRSQQNCKKRAYLKSPSRLRSKNFIDIADNPTAPQGHPQGAVGRQTSSILYVYSPTRNEQ